LPEVFSDVADAPPIDPDFVAIPKFSGSKLKNEPILHQASFPVRFHDLDANGHVNNAVYFEWAYEATPVDLLGWSLREIHGEFRVSVKFGETVSVRVKELRERISLEEAGFRSFVYDMVEAEDCQERSMARFCAIWTPLGADKENKNIEKQCPQPLKKENLKGSGDESPAGCGAEPRGFIENR
jgi:hypothetical protein